MKIPHASKYRSGRGGGLDSTAIMGRNIPTLANNGTSSDEHGYDYATPTSPDHAISTPTKCIVGVAAGLFLLWLFRR